MERKIYLTLTPPETALALLLEKFASPLASEKIPLRHAHGRTLAENAVAAVSSPAFHGAAMDGIATRAEITFGASERRPKTLALGSDAHWINTGHPLPPGCDCVIMVENLVPGRDNQGNESVSVEKAAFPWQHVRKLGEDLVASEILLPAGTVIGPYELAALAATGVLEPVVHKRPAVAIIPSGSEMLPLEEATPERIAGGKHLPEFNSLMLTAMVHEAGGAAVTLPIAPDEPEALRQALHAAAAGPYDLVLLLAGSSAGSRDFTADAIAALGELFVHGLAMMPGKPTAIGSVNGKPVLGIPGYPVSAALAFQRLALPLLTRWQNRPPPYEPSDQAQPIQSLPSRPGMEECIRVKLGRVDGKLLAVPLPRGAGAVSSLSRADGLISVPANAEGILADAATPVVFLHPPSTVENALLTVGSHDNTLDLLDSLLRKHRPGFSLASAHVGSLGGLMALKAGRCHLSGSHLLGTDGKYNQEAIQEHLAGLPVKLVRLVEREQGLILPAGNPQNLAGLADLKRPGVVFVNRQRGSGTRVLLDWELSRLGIAPDAIPGYQDEEYTHMNVAAAVLSGRATVGLGVKAAAVALGLGFVPVGVEEYDLVIPERFWGGLRVQALLTVIRSAEFRRLAEAMGGYRFRRSGEVVWEFGG